MKINETVNRECCQRIKDLKLYQGRLPFGSTVNSFNKIWFCQHCGQLWHHVRKPGDMDAGLERLVILSYE